MLINNEACIKVASHKLLNSAELHMLKHQVSCHVVILLDYLRVHNLVTLMEVFCVLVRLLLCLLLHLIRLRNRTLRDDFLQWLGLWWFLQCIDVDVILKFFLFEVLLHGVDWVTVRGLAVALIGRVSLTLASISLSDRIMLRYSAGKQLFSAPCINIRIVALSSHLFMMFKLLVTIILLPVLLINEMETILVR